ncbi:MAG: Ni/Fe-hydrogenase, b-type cytochrome subunit [Gemmatimonadales bacterium]
MTTTPHAQPIGPAGPASGPDTMLGRRIPRASGDYRWVYLWGLPLRAMHWIAAMSIAVLVVTGLYIGNPFGIAGSPQIGPLMSRVRLLHYLAAVFLATTGIVRAYWLIAGNRFERLPALFPLRPRDLKNLFKMVKFYGFMSRIEDTPHYLGHNPLQQMNYTLVYVITSLEVITGFIMFGLAWPTGTIYKLTNWLVPLFGGIQNVRFVHHAITYFFLIFIPAHIYLSFRADTVEGGGTVSSIITGGRFFDPGHEYEDEHA